MSEKSLAERIALLEGEVIALKQRVEKDKRPWLEEWAGAFLNDPYFAKAAKLGRQYRESLRPKPKKNGK